jgi:hypothetical protein
MIVIPMAGMSRRFAEAGYAQPKYMLQAHGRSLFGHAVESFRAYFETESFLFIARDPGAADFISRECREMGVRRSEIVMLDAPTAGQAETVALGLERGSVEDTTPITIFNIDTFRPGFAFPDAEWRLGSKGYLETFRGSGANWSYVRPSPEVEPLVLETTEKRPVSDLCCTGLYHFEAAGDFRASLAAERRAPSMPELYVAPLYNHLIARGGRVHYTVIGANEVVFCGVPAEYESFLHSPGRR